MNNWRSHVVFVEAKVARKNVKRGPRLRRRTSERTPPCGKKRKAWRGRNSEDTALAPCNMPYFGTKTKEASTKRKPAPRIMLCTGGPPNDGEPKAGNGLATAVSGTCLPRWYRKCRRKCTQERLARSDKVHRSMSLNRRTSGNGSGTTKLRQKKIHELLKLGDRQCVRDVHTQTNSDRIKRGQIHGAQRVGPLVSRR